MVSLHDFMENSTPLFLTNMLVLTTHRSSCRSLLVLYYSTVSDTIMLLHAVARDSSYVVVSGSDILRRNNI